MSFIRDRVKWWEDSGYLARALDILEPEHWAWEQTHATFNHVGLIWRTQSMMRVREGLDVLYFRLPHMLRTIVETYSPSQDHIHNSSITSTSKSKSKVDAAALLHAHLVWHPISTHSQHSGWISSPATAAVSVAATNTGLFAGWRNNVTMTEADE